MQMACEDPGIERLITLIVDRILEYCPTSVESLILPLATDPTFHFGWFAYPYVQRTRSVFAVATRKGSNFDCC